ncbi:MAG: FG-GAP repeat domain-containing protein, partial [Pyrinomonadaceae bacterium]
MYSPRIPARARLFLLPFILPLIVAICPARGAFAAGCARPEFAAAANYTVGTNPAVVAVKDFNGDGNADVAVLNQTSANVFVFLGTGSGGFSAPLIQPVPQYADMTAADFNGDGRLDLALGGSAATSVALLLGDGSGGFAAPVTIPAGSAGSRGITSGDFNGDGKIDLAVSGADFRVRVLINAGGGTFNAPNALYTGTEQSKLAAADFNGDAKVDLVVLNGSNDRNIMVMLGDGAGGLGSPQMFDVGGTPTSLVLSDLDSDQKLDVVVAVGSNVKLLRGNGNGTFASPTVIATGNG